MINTLRSHLGARRGTAPYLAAAVLSGALAFGQCFAATEDKPDSPPGSGAVAPVASGPQQGGEITSLIPKLEAQIAAGHVTSPSGDNAMETLRHILALVPNATPPELEAIDSMPARFDQLAAQAKASGDSTTYDRFSAFRDAFALGGRAGSAEDKLTSRNAPTPAPSPVAATTAPNAVNGTKPEAVPKPPPQETRGKPDATTEENAGAKVTGRPGKTPTVPRDVAADNGIRPDSSTQPANIDSRPISSPPKPPDLTPPPARTDAAKPGPGAGPQPQAGAATVPAPMVAMFVQRGNQRLAEGDISSARLLFERAATARSGAGAFGLARTYDPVFLTQIRAHGIQADLGLAISWYREAAALGEPEAQDALDRLEGLDLESCKRLTMNPPVTP